MIGDLSLGWLLIAAALYCGTRARALDLQLRLRMLPHIELRSRHQVRRELAEERLEDFGYGLAALGLTLIRPHWQRRFHTADGAALVTRFWRLVGGTSVLGVVGLLLVAVGTH